MKKPPDDVADEGGYGRCLERSLERSREVCCIFCLHVTVARIFRCMEKFIFFSAKRDTEPRPIRGFLRDPDFRRGRDPLTGREGYSTIYEARKKVNTLVSRLLIG